MAGAMNKYPMALGVECDQCGDPRLTTVALMTGKAIERTYTAPCDRVWDALMATISHLAIRM
jgi:hypothetical protein